MNNINELKKITLNKKKKDALVSYWLNEAGLSHEEFSKKYEQLINNPETFSEDELRQIFEIVELDFREMKEYEGEINYDALLKSIDNIYTKKTYRSIIKSLEKYDKKIYNWDDTDLDEYLTAVHFTSPNSVIKYITHIRHIYNYACERIGKTPNMVKLKKKPREYIDRPKLRSQIITYNDFKFICEELEFYCDGDFRNLRDKVIFELAWEGLTSSEIKNLKEEDIAIGDDKIKISFPHKTVWITDPVVVEDIKKCKNEIYYYKVDKNGVTYVYQYKQSNKRYLIKPIAIREDANNDQVVNMTIIFNSIMKRLSFDISRKSKNTDGTEYSIDIENLSMEDIRRSKIIWLLSQKHITTDLVRQMFGRKHYADIIWLNRIAKWVYGMGRD